MPRVLCFRNRQRTRTLNVPLLRRIVRLLLEQELGMNDYELGFHFLTGNEMARLNWQYLRHSGSTDVITFDHSEGHSSVAMHGEIFISVPDAVAHSREFKTTWQSELVRYVIHGLLHLRGFDDTAAAKRRAMKKHEQRLLKLAAAEFPIRKVAAPTRRPSRKLNPKS